jgi:hypothetical protein
MTRDAVIRVERRSGWVGGLDVVLAFVVGDDVGLEVLVVDFVEHGAHRRDAERHEQHARGRACQLRRQAEEPPHQAKRNEAARPASSRVSDVRWAMRRQDDLLRPALLTLMVVLAAAAVATPASAQQTVFVVRHAEKADESRDPLLSAAGQARAAALARHLKDAGITVAFVTDLQRTRLTAAPLTEALGIRAVILPAAATADMVDRIRRYHAHDVVLVVGHSNTVPDVLTRFGHTEPVTIRDDEYDALFVLVPRPGGPPAVVRLRY